MIGFPFDSHVTFESDGTPVYDRAITSAPLRKLIAKLLTDGVLPNPSTNLQVEAGSGMNVVVNPGFAICAGGLKLEENQRTLAIQAADSNYDRIDTVVLRWNDNDSERICDLYIVEGIPAASPLRPELTRTESIWELGLADLFINKNSSAISNQRITDTRYETARCGIISAISEFDTTTLYQQVQADLAGFKASEQADFIAWFDDIKGQLSEDAAGNLQKQIGTLEALKTEVKTNLVNALNWVVDKTSGVIAKLGSADISKIGDGTVTGAIVNNKEAIEDVSQSLNMLNKGSGCAYKGIQVIYKRNVDIVEGLYTSAWDGFVQGIAKTAANSGNPFIRLEINGSVIFEGSGVSKNYSYLWSPLFEVRKGDVIKYMLTSDTDDSNKELRIYLHRAR